MNVSETAMQCRYMEYEETDAFYNRLDELIKGKNKVIVRFIDHKLEVNSKLWKRLKNCSNIDEVPASSITPLCTLKCASVVGSVGLIAYIATLIAALIFYGIYKGYRIRLKATPRINGTELGDLELEFDPPK
ncbi:hypothetical protein P5G63_13195 [Aeromonas salmonicida]|uniref:hypothetical protein n=1 Tax=Aeromonas salmonicida TaxID=645 RepID=UPI002240294E|nr:hypothetical protein [Aeromonas salmonicida]MDF8329396.1 hypothetical protein [Aeromonas salmonicida]